MTTASVSTHILDTSRGRPAEGVAVTLSARPGPDAPWTAHGSSATDADGRCKDLPAPPEGTAHVRLDFAVEPYLTGRPGARPAPGRTPEPIPESASEPTAHPAPHPEPHPASPSRPGSEPVRDTAGNQAEAQQDAPRTDSGPRDSGVFFPEVSIVFAVAPGEHYHVPLLLNPFGYSVYRGS